MILRRPVLISAVTDIPGDKLTSLLSIRMALAPSEYPGSKHHVLRFRRLLVFRMGGFVFGLIGRYRIAGDVHDAARKQPVAGEGEGVDLDLGFLALLNEADVLVRDHGLDLDLGCRPAPRS